MVKNMQDVSASEEKAKDNNQEAAATTTNAANANSAAAAATANVANPNAAAAGIETKIKRETKEIPERSSGESLFESNDLGVLNEVSITLTIEIGRAQIKIRDLLNLTKGSIIELNKSAGDPVDIYANGKLIATGNIITANGKYCVRVTSVPEKNKLGVEVDGK